MGCADLRRGKAREGIMCCVWLCSECAEETRRYDEGEEGRIERNERFSPVVIELPDTGGVFPECFGSCKRRCLKISPIAPRASEGRQTWVGSLAKKCELVSLIT